MKGSTWIDRAGGTLTASLVALAVLSLGLSGPALASTQRAAVGDFPHESEEHRTLSCSSCHVTTVAAPDVEAFPPHQQCVSCHNFAKEAMEGGAAYCQVCHQGGQLSADLPKMLGFLHSAKSVDGERVGNGLSEFGLPFLHPPHLKPGHETAPLPTCSDCHDSSTSELDPEPSATTSLKIPEMPVPHPHSLCFTCHGKEPVAEPAMDSCAGCHTPGASASTLLLTVPVAARQSPEIGFRHSDHQFDIRPRTKEELRVGKAGDLCLECHAPLLRESAMDQSSPKARVILDTEVCGQCHRGVLGLPESLDRQILEGLREP